MPATSMPSNDEVTLWIARLCEGDSRAPQVIWEYYFERLARLALQELKHVPKREADEEDIALSAMNSFLMGARAGRFPKLNDRTDLWRLLVKITARKAVAQQRRHFATKRGAGKVRGDSAFENGSSGRAGGGIDQVLGNEPTPELAVTAAETCRELLDRLDDATLQRIARLKLEGYTNQEIADELDCALRTVKRKLQRVRQLWTAENDE